MATQQLMQQLLLLTLALLLCHAFGNAADADFNCREIFQVSGHQSNPRSRGTFASDNFPHALPVGSRCRYEFQTAYINIADAEVAFCLQFKELDLFTESDSSADETRIELRVVNLPNPILVYAGNGSLLEEVSYQQKVVIRRPDNLLEGPLCLKRSYIYYTYTLDVFNSMFLRIGRDRVTRFLADYAVVDAKSLDRLGDDNSTTEGLHRCLDDKYINKGKRCNAAKDCNSDFFFGASSDESYEHARCNFPNSFGTNFARGQASAHRFAGGVDLDCMSSAGDHSRHFAPALDIRNCGLIVPRRPAEAVEALPMLRLGGIQPTARWGSVACYRFYWRSAGFNYPDESLTITAPGDSGPALLRLDGRPANDQWNLVELQVDTPVSSGGDWLNVFSLRPANRTGAGPRHWLDDLSAEAAACDESAYESRMPSVCSFEWSTCGWETRNLPVVRDSAVANAYRVGFTDRTSDSLPIRIIPPSAQWVLQLSRGSNSSTAQMRATRRLPYGNRWCLGIWFYGLGNRGYSVRLDALVQMQAPMQNRIVRLTATAPTNKWHLLSGNLVLGGSASALSSLTVGLETMWHSELQLVLLDDVSVTAGSCYAYDNERNGTVECGSSEWRCANRLQCIPQRNRCDGRRHCSDGSDEVNCPSRGDSDNYWQQLSMRIAMGIVLIVGGFALLMACLRLRSTRMQRQADQGRSTARSVTDGRLPDELRSDRRRQHGRWHRSPDMPPDYYDVAEGAANAGFAVDEEPPKYDEAVEAMRMQQQQQQEQARERTVSDV